MAVLGSPDSQEDITNGVRALKGCCCCHGPGPDAVAFQARMRAGTFCMSIHAVSASCQHNGCLQDQAWLAGFAP